MIHSLIGDFVATVPTPGTAVALSDTDLYVRGLTIFPKTATGANTSVVFVGISTLDQPDYTILMYTILAIHTKPFNIPIPPGGQINLKDMYVDAIVADDGIVGLYFT